MVAISSSRVEGWRDPLGPAKVPAPQGEPVRSEGECPVPWDDNDGLSALTTVNLRQVCQLSECLRITERNINDPVVGEGGHGCNNRRFLTSSVTSSRDEDSGVLPVQTSRRPKTASGVPERLCVGVVVQIINLRIDKVTERTHLPLCREVTVTGGNAK